MNQRERDDTVFDIVGISLWLVVGGLFGTAIYVSNHDACVSCDDIMRAGCGEYVIVDPATGRTEFRLKEMK